MRLEKERKELLQWERSDRFEKIKKFKEKWSKERQETKKNKNSTKTFFCPLKPNKIQPLVTVAGIQGKIQQNSFPTH